MVQKQDLTTIVLNTSGLKEMDLGRGPCIDYAALSEDGSRYSSRFLVRKELVDDVEESGSQLNIKLKPGVTPSIDCRMLYLKADLPATIGFRVPYWMRRFVHREMVHIPIPFVHRSEFCTELEFSGFTTKGYVERVQVGNKRLYERP